MNMTIREEIVWVGRKLYERGFVAANDGNISARDSDGDLWITPTGVSKGDLTEDSLLKVDVYGNIKAGNGKKSSETEMHLRIYRDNPDVMAVVHAHPAYATSFAIAEIPLDQPYYPEALVLLGNVPVSPYAKPGTMAVPDSIAPYIRDHKALLMSHHGALTWGKNLKEAYYRMESLENYARITMMTRYILKSENVLSAEQVDDLLHQ